MGNCMARMKAEMQAPPQNMVYNNSLTPHRGSVASRRQQQYDANGAPVRRETQSGVPGLTYDQAGRPVWRDPTLKWDGDKVRHEHFEGNKS